MRAGQSPGSIAPVALLAEGVDRNCWASLAEGAQLVALLAEGVDRNFQGDASPLIALRRPPRGGRG